MKPRESIWVAVSAAALGYMAPLSAQAQSAGPAEASASGELAEVIVTAERRSADVQKTGVSVAVRVGDDLVREGKTTLSQILEDVPGVSGIPVLPGTTPTDNTTGGIVIRGVAPNTGPPTDSQVSTTALYADGVYGGIGSDYDIDRVEVLRGPQGTLYGRSATGGVLSIATRDPVLGEWGGDVNLEYGTYALQHASAALNIAASDHFAVRVAGEDYVQNGFLGKGGKVGATGGRVKALYQPSANFSLLLGWAIQTDSNEVGGPSATFNYGAPNTIVISPPVNPNAVSTVTDTSHQYWARLNWNLGFGTLTYMPALRTFANDSPYELVFPFFTSHVTQDYKQDQIHTEELHLASNPGSAVSWIVGGWYYERLYKYDQDTVWEPSGAYSHGPHIRKNTDNEAVFGEATYPFADTWRATAGLRYDHTHIDSFGSTYTLNHNEGSCGGVFFPGPPTPACNAFSANYSLPNNNETFVLPQSESLITQNNVTFKLRVEKDLTPTSLLYAMVSTGFLPSDLVIGNSGPTPATQTIHGYNYQSETLRSYEIGSKNRFRDNTLQINGSLYYYDYSGYQTIINIAGGGPAPNNVLATSPARMMGAELETLWQITPNDRAGLSGGYVDARYVDRSAFFATWVSQTRIPGAPPLTAQARYDHMFPLTNGSSLQLGADAFYASGYDETPVSVASLALGAGAYVHSGSEAVYNAHTTWTSASSKYSLTGYVRNIGDNVYKTRAQVNGFGAPGQIFAVVIPSAPRVYGVVLHATF